ncbi:putative quinol monooxygenase [Fodinicola feengrottensis]|uniref:putative quinol monooxygenase n=1 Tax=Fodinicola feengrottensis TaxID=435914 RepID=UPI0036F2D669
MNEDADGFVMIEQWVSQEALTKHGGLPALAEMNVALKGKMAKPVDLRFLSPVPAGDPSHGQVRS